MTNDKFLKRGEIVTALTIIGVVLLTVVTFISNTFLAKNKITSSSKASGCAVITKVDDPGPLSSGQDFTCSGTLDPAFSGSTNIACGWSKNNGWPQNGGRWINPTCNGVNCSFGIRMDTFSNTTTDSYRLVMFDMSSNCGPANGKSIPITLYGITPPSPTATPKVSPPCDPGKLDKNGNCNSACCANNSQCPSGQACIVTNGYCQSNFSCGVAPTSPPNPTNTPKPKATNTPIPKPTPTTIPNCNSSSCNFSNSYCQSTCGTGWYCTGSYCQPPPTPTPFPSSTPIPSSTPMSSSTPTPTASIPTSTLAPGVPTYTPIPNPSSTPTQIPTSTPAPTPSCKLLMGNGDKDNKFDIVFLADNYNNLSDFLSDSAISVQKIQQTNLGLSRLSKLDVWVYQDISQTYYQNDYTDPPTGRTFIIWDINKADQIARNCAGDISVVFYNNRNDYADRYFAVTGRQEGLRSIFAYSRALPYITVPHELGHGIADLVDEYPFLSPQGIPLQAPWGTDPGINCSSASSNSPTTPCPIWANQFPQVGCYQRCGWANYYRPATKSIMDGGGFGEVYTFNDPSLINGWDVNLKNYQ